jgi:hypothetical protein
LYNIKTGEHSLIVYPDLAELREVYTSFCRHALIDNNNLVVILYHYDNPNNIRYYLQNIGIDAAKYENESSLLILDSYEPSHFIRDSRDIYISNNSSNGSGSSSSNGSNGSIKNDGIDDGISSIINFNSSSNIRNSITAFESLLRKAQKNGKDGISIIADMGSFFRNGDSKENMELLLNFENAIPKEFSDVNIVRLCLYHRSDINKIADKDKKKLCNMHLQCFRLKESR